METYDISPVEESVQIGDKNYVIRETSEHAVSKWRNSQTDKVELRNGKPVRIEGAALGDSFLLSLCLFEITNENHRNLVDVDVIRSWPSRVVVELVKTLKKISDIKDDEPKPKPCEECGHVNEPKPCDKCGHVDEEAEEEAKKKSRETTAVSD